MARAFRTLLFCFGGPALDHRVRLRPTYRMWRRAARPDENQLTNAVHSASAKARAVIAMRPPATTRSSRVSFRRSLNESTSPAPKPPAKPPAGAKLTNPEHVEEDVKQATVQVDRGEDRSPPPVTPRNGATHAEIDERALAR